MDVWELRAARVAPEIVGAAKNFLPGEPGRHRRHQRGPRALHRAAGLRSSSSSPSRPGSPATTPPAAPSPPRWRPTARSRLFFINQGEGQVDTRDSSPRPREVPSRWLPVPKARKRALDVLYASELRGGVPRRTRWTGRSPTVRGPSNDCTAVLVRGVEASRAHRRVLTSYAEGWTLQRMPAVDHNMLRLGVWETPSTPPTSQGRSPCRRRWRWSPSCRPTESPQFVNGMLGSILRDRASWS